MPQRFVAAMLGVSGVSRLVRRGSQTRPRPPPGGKCRLVFSHYFSHYDDATHRSMHTAPGEGVL